MREFKTGTQTAAQYLTETLNLTSIQLQATTKSPFISKIREHVAQ